MTRYHSNGGDVLFGSIRLREEQIARQLRDYAIEGRIAHEAGQFEVFDEVAEFSRQLKAAVEEAARWSRCAAIAPGWAGFGLRGVA